MVHGDSCLSNKPSTGSFSSLKTASLPAGFSGPLPSRHRCRHLSGLPREAVPFSLVELTASAFIGLVGGCKFEASPEYTSGSHGIGRCIAKQLGSKDFSAMKKDEAIPFAGKSMQPEMVLFRELHQSGKDKCFPSSVGPILYRYTKPRMC